jgi:hypothetical protein
MATQLSQDPTTEPDFTITCKLAAAADILGRAAYGEMSLEAGVSAALNLLPAVMLHEAQR